MINDDRYGESSGTNGMDNSQFLSHNGDRLSGRQRDDDNDLVEEKGLGDINMAEELMEFNNDMGGGDG